MYSNDWCDPCQIIEDTQCTHIARVQDKIDAGERVSHAVVLMQREVARRTVARPGKRDFGYLSLLCQAHSRPELLFSVPPGAFRPPPKVTSALVRFSIEPQLARWGVADRQAFLEFAQLCFHHKRKTLRNNLEPRFGRQRLASLRRRTWVLATAAGAGLAWLLGMVPSTIMALRPGDAGAAPPSEPGALVQYTLVCVRTTNEWPGLSGRLSNANDGEGRGAVGSRPQARNNSGTRMSARVYMVDLQRKVLLAGAGGA